MLRDRAFPLVVTGGSDVADHAALMTGLHVFLDPDHNGQLLPAGRKLQPLRNVAVIIFLLPIKLKRTFQHVSNHRTIAVKPSAEGKWVFLAVVVHVGGK